MRLRGNGRLRVNKPSQEVSPMESMGNLADAMLVFACGLMLALIVNWNIDVTKVSDNQKEVKNISEQTEQTEQNISEFQEMGTVYMDPNTGKYYVIEDVQE